MRSGLTFVALGLDHTTAGIDVRERLAFTDSEIPMVLRQITDPASPLLEQAALLSTCNRVELYGVSRSQPDQRRLCNFLAQYHGLHQSQVRDVLYVYCDDQVARHLAWTAAGLHSLALGEAQILGQVRKALDDALTAGTAGPELRRLFESAVAAARRARSQTAIGRGVTSIPHAGVEFGCRRMGTLRDSTVLLIGAGTVADLAAKQLVKRGAKQLLILSRARGSASRLARSCGGHPIAPSQLPEALAKSDLVISATGAREVVLRRAELEHARRHRGIGAKPLLVIDLSIPRDVEPTATGINGVEVVAIDDLRGTVENALLRRRTELPKAKAILEIELARFTSWVERREAFTKCLTA